MRFCSLDKRERPKYDAWRKTLGATDVTMFSTSLTWASTNVNEVEDWYRSLPSLHGGLVREIEERGPLTRHKQAMHHKIPSSTFSRQPWLTEVKHAIKPKATTSRKERGRGRTQDPGLLFCFGFPFPSKTITSADSVFISYH